ncbi:sterol desaturase family protein [Nannocystis pusilla]|uniref:sterol desaturase family protein n=1 Tax=Nannocystis pusilla TaxID=889268 RepID=UPI003BF2BEE7
MSDETDPLLLFLRSFLGQATLYFALVGLTFLAVWRLGERRFRGRRIQEKRRVDGKQLRHEVKHTLVTLLIGTIDALAITLLYQAGLTALSNDPAEWSWPALVLSFVGMIVFNDAWFYWWHRFLHRPGVFRYAHAVHHKSVDVSPFSSYSFHAIEAFILGAWSIPLLMFVPLYIPVLAALQIVGLVNNIVAHLGYEFMPRWFIRVPPLKWLTTSTYHNLHHTRFSGNYALFFRFWDRLLGTEVPDYEQKFRERGAVASVGGA